MDVVLVGLPGSGKSVVGKRLAHRHGATFIDLDERIERERRPADPDDLRGGRRGRLPGAGAARPSPTSARPTRSPAIRRVIATGGGAVVDPRNRWALYRGRLSRLARRPARGPRPAPAPIAARPAARRPAATRSARSATWPRGASGSTRRPTSASTGVAEVAERRRRGRGRACAARAAGARPRHRPLLRAATPIGRIVLGEGIAGASGRRGARAGSEARRAILVSEPGAWAAVGAALADGLRGRRLDGRHGHAARGRGGQAPGGHRGRRRSELARLRVERDEPIVAIGGGALGDAAGFLAATYLRGIPIIHVPTTLVAQIDSSIGGKTAVDLPEGKNLVGAFHQPAAIVIDVALPRGRCPSASGGPRSARRSRWPPSATSGCSSCSRRDGDAIARGDAAALERGVVAELVERCAWAKVEVVVADERERGPRGGRITLNLGHSLGHAVEAAAGYRRAAPRRGRRVRAAGGVPDRRGGSG